MNVYRKYEYTREKLVEFKKELEAKAAKKSGGDEEGGGFGGGFGGGGGAAKSHSAKKFSDQQKSKDAANKVSNLVGLKPLWTNIDSMSPLMKQTVRGTEIKLVFEQKQLLKNIQERIELFDAELKSKIFS